MPTILSTCFTLLLLTLPVHGSQDNAFFSQILQLETRWDRLSEKTIEQYLIFLGEQQLYAGLSLKATAKLQGEIRIELAQRLYWERVEEKVITVMLSECSDATLETFAETYRGKSQEESIAAASQQLTCTSQYLDHAITIMQEEFRQAIPTIRRIAKKYGP